MYYIIQILAAMLIGISIAALTGQRTSFIMIGSVLAIAFGVAIIAAVPSWWVLWGGLACFVLGQLLHRESFSGSAR